MIKTKELVKCFDSVKALDGISINVKKGSVYGLVGPNGAGKTTLIKTLLGVYKQNQGEVEIDGKYYQSLSLTESDGATIQYFFDNKTNRLFKTTYKYGKNVVDVLYSDYKNIDDEQFRPFKCKILLNSKLYAEINFDFIVKRDGLIFPN